jgi:hypothetical protein
MNQIKLALSLACSIVVLAVLDRLMPLLWRSPPRPADTQNKIGRYSRPL